MRRRLAFAVLFVFCVPAARAATPMPPISADTSFAPLVHAFADPVTAQVTVGVDPARIDPASVRVVPSFAPYAAGPARVERRGGGVHLVVLRFSFRLRCITAACVPRAPEKSFTLRPAVVRWQSRGGRAGSARLAWPPLTVASRVTPRDLALPTLLARDEPPAPSYSVPPGPLGIFLLALGAALAAAGAIALAVLLRPRARAVTTPPLQHALQLVELAALGEIVERRRALYRLALALEEARLEPESHAARKLAWAPAAPDSDGMLQLALVIRGQLREAA
ncbi:MAG: hypothetical protein ACXVZ4_06920 [Gaiellaceae bacterium]